MSITFNRTIVELKHEYPISVSSIILAFNRTIVELKHDQSGDAPFSEEAFNRTIVELKRYSRRKAIGLPLLLIEPLWN